MRPPFRLPLLVLVVLSLALAVPTVGGVAFGHPADAADTDHDTKKNFEDNCATNYNPKQQDTDGDAVVVDAGAYKYYPAPGEPGHGGPRSGGDACDADDDNDGKDDPLDNCRLIVNPDQKDSDLDGLGDPCDFDDDGDGTDDEVDNCPSLANPDQKDSDKDGIGDLCDPDSPKAAVAGALGGADPNDKAAPKIAIKLPSMLQFAALQAGLAVPVTCSEGCIVESRLLVAAKTAKRLKLARQSNGTALLGKGSALVEAKGLTYVFMRFSKGAMARIARAGKVGAQLEVKALDASGNAVTVRKRLTLKR